MKVWLDDKRQEPRGWHRCLWPDEVIELIETGMVTEISLDHDLGNDKRGTGYDVIKWIEEQIVTNQEFTPPMIHVHSSNTSAKDKMRAGIAQIIRLYRMRNKGL